MTGEVLLGRLADRRFSVVIDGCGMVTAAPEDGAEDDIAAAVCSEIVTALGDAIQGGYVGGHNLITD
jgi:hypothetical protein